jgi:putative sigma-54 modulation protein
MDPQIRGNDIGVTDELREFARKRIQKLDRHIDRVIESKLELKKRHQRTGGDLITAQLTIQTGRRLLRAEEQAHDPLRAIDLVIDTMDRQVRKVHERRTDRKGRPPVAATMHGVDESDQEELDFSIDAEEYSHIVRTKRFAVKPMDPEEAVEQMELLGHDFFLFHNVQDDRLNVLYRRRDGTYGLLMPDYS